MLGLDRDVGGAGDKIEEAGRYGGDGGDVTSTLDHPVVGVLNNTGNLVRHHPISTNEPV